MTASGDRTRLLRLIRRDARGRYLYERIGFRSGSHDTSLPVVGFDGPAGMSRRDMEELPFRPPDHHVELFLRMRSLGR